LGQGLAALLQVKVAAAPAGNPRYVEQFIKTLLLAVLLVSKMQHLGRQMLLAATGTAGVSVPCGRHLQT
jgi:hypothetical protein